jgi:hypothetical protein
MALPIPTARRISSRAVRASEPTRMNSWFRNTWAFLISPPCSTEYVAHWRLVHAIGATISVPNSQNGGLKFTPASAAAALAVAKNPRTPSTLPANPSSFACASPGFVNRNSRRTIANEMRMAYHMMYWKRT